MHVPINVKSPNNIRKWQMGFNSAFKSLSLQRIKFNRLSLEEAAKRNLSPISWSPSSPKLLRPLKEVHLNDTLPISLKLFFSPSSVPPYILDPVV
jgi:hypothetical protein